MNKKVVGLIPIKLNNQRLPGKNTMQLGDKALCQYLFETLKNVHSIDEIYVYCSNESIKSYIPKYINFLKRDPQLDLDTVKSKDILMAFINQIHADVYALMHVTQPFIRKETIDNVVRKVVYDNYDSAFVAHEIKEFTWFKNKPLNYEFTNVVRTQELEPIYTEGELFVFEKDVFLIHGRRIGENPFIQPIQWEEAVCIDTKDDFEMAEAIINLRKEEMKR